MRCSKYKWQESCDRKNHKNNLASKHTCLFLLGRPKFDEIVSNVEFETANDEMRKSDDAESDKKHFGPKMEQSLCSNFSHDAASIRDEKWSCFCWSIEWFHIWENFDNFDDDCLPAKHGWIEFKSEKRRKRISNKWYWDAAQKNLSKYLFESIRMGNCQNTR